jgi:hypothetical protein
MPTRLQAKVLAIMPGRIVALVIAMSWLKGSATAGFETVGVAACPPVVEYSREFQAQAAEEMASLPESSAIVEMLSDYPVMRVQARACIRWNSVP